MDTPTSLKLAEQFLDGARTALDSGAYDAAYANAAVAATHAVRVLTADGSVRTHDHEPRATALVDTAEVNGQLPGRTARELRAMLDTRWRGVFEPVDREDAAHAQHLASGVTATAARCLSRRHSVGLSSHSRHVDPGASRSL